ncbi:MAG TPA: hypothetical protein V6D11_27965 [Waterburya sp.]
MDGAEARDSPEQFPTADLIVLTTCDRDEDIYRGLQRHVTSFPSLPKVTTVASKRFENYDQFAII